jgi:hypothetical protein
MTDQVLYLSLFFQASPVAIDNRLKNVTQENQGWNAWQWDLAS